MKKIVCAVALVIAGCTTTPRTFALPDGQTGYLIECNGTANSIASCYNYAANYCGGKYEVVGQDSATGVVAVSGVASPLMKRSLQFTCPKT